MFRARITFMGVAACVGFSALSGCGSVNTVTVDNPVMPDPPPRIADASSGHLRPSLARSEFAGQVTVVAAEFSGKDAVLDAGFLDSQVVATVDGTPLFAADVLAQYEANLRKAQLEVPPAEFQQIRTALVKRDLQRHVENTVVVNALKSTLSAEQIEMLEERLDEMFDNQIEQWKRQFGLSTLPEVELELQEQGASLVALRRSFFSQTMGRQFLREKVGAPRDIGRPELLAYYRERREDYRIPARVKWRQIRIDMNKDGGRSVAADVLQQVVAALRSNADFATVARQHSHGPTAKDGGDRGWLTKDSLSNEEIERALFSLPIGSVSQVFTGKNSYQIVVVDDRESGGSRPFGEVQAEIEAAISEQEQQQAIQDVLDALVAKATVVTCLDDVRATGADSALPAGAQQ
ncbi:MAG: peptidylprolyl isomerase [Planctomycetaceae bacterium]